MTNALPIRIKTISQCHETMGLPKPEHPLISVINFNSFIQKPFNEPVSFIYDFYAIYLKRITNAKFKYGHQASDFDEGVLFFMAPNQLFSIQPEKGKTLRPSGWGILFHPDFIWNTTLAKIIKQYEFFDYSVNEALYLSGKEEKKIVSIIKSIQQEYQFNTDKFSQQIIASQIETLLNFSERFYHRQFITRKKTNHQILSRLEDTLAKYFNNDDLIAQGLPTVQFIADTLNISPNYLSDVLKVLTGQSTQQHIHSKLIEKAKEKLSGTDLSISEIAYELGFEHPQSFTKLFKSKTNLSPLKFRNSFN
ncbi:transcriptional regulator, AraC family protein [Pedobacter sp. BAL39]|uniref:helix-turn-helix domain-containing protein n=1 Tax=Pedobacter sp. BAL39 TaxID=391596 RepID=UPI000155A0D9|nr:helix-turn-helix transcriptional regulator [Pedobacter sp. BAL39]EDM37918.1 transcriptional regulator, AraC family protein [Pedobacter sp. BAL39]